MISFATRAASLGGAGAAATEATAVRTEARRRVKNMTKIGGKLEAG